MALTFTVRIDDNRIGHVEVRRREGHDLRDRMALDNVIGTYDVTLDGRDQGQVRHRYGDGAYRLVSIAADYLWADGSTATLIDDILRNAVVVPLPPEPPRSSVGHTCPHCRITTYVVEDVIDQYCIHCNHFCADVELIEELVEQFGRVPNTEEPD